MCIRDRITIDRKRHIVLVDDVEFPWMLAEDGPGVDYSVIANGFEHIRHIPEVRNQAVVMRTEGGRLIGNPDVLISNVEQHDDGSVTATLTPSDGEWRTAGRMRD